jgi:hypothetical protein
VGIHLDGHRDGMPVGRHHPDAEQHAMGDLPGRFACQAADSGTEPLARVPRCRQCPDPDSRRR